MQATHGSSNTAQYIFGEHASCEEPEVYLLYVEALSQSLHPLIEMRWTSWRQKYPKNCCSKSYIKYNPNALKSSYRNIRSLRRFWHRSALHSKLTLNLSRRMLGLVWEQQVWHLKYVQQQQHQLSERALHMLMRSIKITRSMEPKGI